MCDSVLAHIGICRRKFTPLLAAACLIAVPGCGGDDDSASTVSSAPAATETTPAETVTADTETHPAPTETIAPTETAPTETSPGGGGDEEPARTLALFTARDGRIRPRAVRVPAFISVQIELRSADGQTYALRFGDVTIKAGGQLNSVSKTIDGLRPNESIAGVPTGPGNRVTISATAEPGP